MMGTHSPLSDNLRSWIAVILRGSLPPAELNRFVALCHSLAIAAVKQKVSFATLQTRILHNSYSDLAYDCIADLFRTDEAGCLVQLKAYFDGIECANASDKELLAHLRRLIFSRVNQGLFRILNEVDPALGKILRNTKLAIQALQNFAVIERLGEACIYPAMSDPLEHIPQIGREDLELALRRSANGSENIPTLLARLSLYLRQQHDHSRIVPLISVAVVFRNLYERQVATVSESTEMEDPFTSDEIAAAIRACCQKLKAELRNKYVVRKRVTPELYDGYFSVIEQAVSLRLISENGDQLSLFEALHQQVPELTRNSYNRNHRAKLEYLARLAYASAVESLKSDR